MLTVFDRLDCFWPLLTVFDRFDCIWPYWPSLTVLTVFDQFWLFWQFLTVLTVLTVVDRCWQLLTVLDRFGPFLTVFDRFGLFWNVLTVINNFWPFLTFFVHFWPISTFLVEYHTRTRGPSVTRMQDFSRLVSLLCVFQIIAIAHKKSVTFGFKMLSVALIWVKYAQNFWFGHKFKHCALYCTSLYSTDQTALARVHFVYFPFPFSSIDQWVTAEETQNSTVQCSLVICNAK